MPKDRRSIYCSDLCNSRNYARKNKERRQASSRKAQIKKALENPNSYLVKREALKPIVEGDITKIPLKEDRSVFSIIDTEDLPLLGNRIFRETEFHYAKTQNTFLHRIIMNAPKGVQVDHINRNTLDNRKSNLRFASASENRTNAGLKVTNTSGYKGVYAFPDGKRWRASIRSKGNIYYLGNFKSGIEAAKAYDQAAKKYHGEFAWLNFPEA